MWAHVFLKLSVISHNEAKTFLKSPLNFSLPLQFQEIFSYFSFSISSEIDYFIQMRLQDGFDSIVFLQRITRDKKIKIIQASEVGCHKILLQRQRNHKFRKNFEIYGTDQIHWRSSKHSKVFREHPWHRWQFEHIRPSPQIPYRSFFPPQTSPGPFVQSFWPHGSISQPYLHFFSLFTALARLKAQILG